MKPKWKVFIGILLWIALAGIIHYTRISWLKESPNWNESSPDDSIRSHVLSFALILSYPGLVVSSYLPLLRGLPMDLDGFSTFAEVFDDILYAFVIAFVFLKLRLKHKVGWVFDYCVKSKKTKMKTVLILAPVFLCLLAGCSTGKHSKASVSGPAQKLEDADEFKIEVAVYGYLLERHFPDQGEYSAIFLEGSDAWVAALIRKFPNHVPPIKPSNRMQLHPNQMPIDKDTGKPAMILGVEAMDPTNGVAEAIGTWYAGGAVSGLYAFVLVKADGEWTIQSAK